MSVIQTIRTNEFEQWRLNTNQDSANLGDIANVYSSDGADVISISTADTFGTHPVVVLALNDLNSRKIKKSGDTILYLSVTGALTALTFNKLTLTQPANGSTFTLADGKTFAVSNTLTFTGTDGSSAAFGTGGTVAYKGETLAQFASTTSAQLRGVLSDPTGNGVAVFGTSPTFTTSVITGSSSFDVFNTTATTVNAFGVATSLSIGGTSTASVTYNFGANATASSNTKTINIGTGAAASSTTNINIGSAAGGITTINGIVQLTSGSTKIGNTSLIQGGAVNITLPTLAGTLVGSGDTGTVTNLMLAGSIADSKLSQITTASKVSVSAITGTLPTSNGGTGLAATGTAYQLLGVGVTSNGDLEYKTLSNGAGISIVQTAGGITIASDGALPAGSSTDTTFRVGLNLLVGSWNGSGHNTVTSTNALEVRPGSGNTYTNLFAVYSDNAGTSSVFKLNTSGDVTVGANKVTIANATGNTVIAGTLGIGSTFTIASVATYDIATPAAATSGTIDTFLTTSYKSAKYRIQMTNTAGYEVCEFLVISNGTNVYYTEFGRIGAPTAIVLSASVITNTVTVSWSGSATNATMKVLKEYIAA